MTRQKRAQYAALLHHLSDVQLQEELDCLAQKHQEAQCRFYLATQETARRQRAVEQAAQLTLPESGAERGP